MSLGAPYTAVHAKSYLHLQREGVVMFVFVSYIRVKAQTGIPRDSGVGD